MGLKPLRETRDGDITAALPTGALGSSGGPRAGGGAGDAGVESSESSSASDSGSGASAGAATLVMRGASRWSSYHSVPSRRAKGQ